MIHWYYQLYSQELLSALNTQNKVDKESKSKSHPKFMFTTILQFDGVSDLNLHYRPQKSQESKIDYLSEYFQATWKKQKPSPYTNNEYNYGDIERIKMVRNMKYVNPYVFNSWTSKHKADVLAKEKFEDGFKLYEDIRLKDRFEHLIYKTKQLVDKEGFSDIINRTHSLNAETLYYRSKPSLLSMEEFDYLLKKKNHDNK